ncbi:MAG: IS3 family transposase, partial [Bacteriovorax sp.]|nr:IS3 family transposase [Bacteriovorax sp.]
MGVSKKKTCEVLSLNYRSVVRWEKNKLRPDQRKGPKSCSYALSIEEKEVVIKTATSDEFKDSSPRQIVPTLADRGIFIASESSFYKVLKEYKMIKHRGKSKRPEARAVQGLLATSPNKVWSWDITYLNSPIKGKFYYLYLVMDVFSRMIIGWRIEEEQSSEYASALIDHCCRKFRIKKKQLSLHSDNGGPMKGATMLATLYKLGVVPSFSRPRVSDDNPFSESLFKTIKYHASMPANGTTMEKYKGWMNTLENWYNNKHLHSQINYVTPASRHFGTDKEILEKRKVVYQIAKEANPNRWKKKERSWNY